MKNSKDFPMINKNKMLFINLLFGSAILIMFLGLYFCFYSFINQISINVLRSSISGIVFGALVFYLGLRYFLSVKKLQIEISKESSTFSLHPFKKQERYKKSN